MFIQTLTSNMFKWTLTLMSACNFIRSCVRPLSFAQLSIIFFQSFIFFYRRITFMLCLSIYIYHCTYLYHQAVILHKYVRVNRACKNFFLDNFDTMSGYLINTFLYSALESTEQISWFIMHNDYLQVRT